MKNTTTTVTGEVDNFADCYYHQRQRHLEQQIREQRRLHQPELSTQTFNHNLHVTPSRLPGGRLPGRVHRQK